MQVEIKTFARVAWMLSLVREVIAVSRALWIVAFFISFGLSGSHALAQCNALPGTGGTWRGPWNWSCQILNTGCGQDEFSAAALIPQGPYRGMVLMVAQECAGPNIPAPQTTNVYIFNPAAPTKLLRVNQLLASNIFCLGLSWDKSGQLVVAGGAVINGVPPKEAYRFSPLALGTVALGSTDPCTADVISGSPWTQVGSMSIERYYPSLFTLCKGIIPSTQGFGPIPGASTMVMGGAPHPNVDQGVEIWQLLPPPAGGTTPPWSQILYPNSGGDPGHQPQPPTTYEQYVRRALPGIALPEPKLDSYPRVVQLANTVTGQQIFEKNIFVANDIDTTIGFSFTTQPRSSWVARPPYSATLLQDWEYWTGPLAQEDRFYGAIALLHTRTPNLPHSNGQNRVLAFGGAHGLNIVSTTNPVTHTQANWAITSTTEEFNPRADPTGGLGGGSWVPHVVGISTPRLYNNAVVLPTGEILIIGGACQINSNAGTLTPAYAPELYYPGAAGTGALATSQMMSSSPNAPNAATPYARLYHNVAVLLPDATVLSFGGSPEIPPDPSYSGEIFVPPYLGYGFRPAITQTSSDEIGFGTTFDVTVTYGAGHEIDGFVLLRPAAITHNYDADQRYVELASSLLAGTTYSVTAPPDDLGPPGFYMLFVIEKDASTVPARRVPSVGHFIRLR